MPVLASRRNQSFLLPVDVDDWVALDHPARFVWAYVQELDLASLGIQDMPSHLGRPSYPARELLAIWIYGFMVRTRSSRGLERACRESLPFMWLSGILQPDHVTIWHFRDENWDRMKGLFGHTVRTAVDVGMVDFAVQSVDGSKIAVASQGKLRRRKHLTKLLAQVEQEVAEMDEQERKGDPGEDSGKRRRARAHKVNMRERVRAALAQVEAAAQTSKSKREPVALVSDPEARFMKTRHGIEPAYNAQIVVDGKAQIIVTADVTQDNTDSGQLLPLLEQEQECLGQTAEKTLADNGYYSVANLEQASEHTDLYAPDKTYETNLKKAPDYHISKFTYRPDQDSYLCPEGKELLFVRNTGINGRRNQSRRGRQYHCRECADCLVRAKCTEAKTGRWVTRTDDLALQEAHRAKMATEEGRELIKLRPHMVESVFGTIKEQQGGRRFLTRGLAKVTQEWYLLCAAFNMRKLCKNWQNAVSAAA